MSTKFTLTELEWNNNVKSANGVDDGAFLLYGDTFTASATISENYSMKFSSPRYPVEGGVPISNSGATTGQVVTINAVTSNTNMGILDNISSTQAILQALSSSAVGQLFNAETKTQKAYAQLMLWASSGVPLFLTTNYARNGYYDSYGDPAPWQITSFNINRDRRTGDAMGYTLILEQIFIARIARATAGQLVEFKEVQAVGNQEPLLPTNEQPLGEFQDLSNEKIGKNQATGGNYKSQVEAAASGGS